MASSSLSPNRRRRRQTPSTTIASPSTTKCDAAVDVTAYTMHRIQAAKTNYHSPSSTPAQVSSIRAMSIKYERVPLEEEHGEEDDELSCSSDSEVCHALDDIEVVNTNKARRPNAHGGHHSRANLSSHLQPPRFRTSSLEDCEGNLNFGMSNSVETEIRSCVRQMSIGKIKTTDKADYATVEQAIDPKTRFVLGNMINANHFDRMNGCIATGKEANVYHAIKFDGQELAVKVHKTSVMVFKNRDRYIKGDPRFEHKYCGHNPRKMVYAWAEKEMRNLLRLKKAGISCPTPVHLKDNVLVMEFIGKGGHPAPLLKDAALSLDKLCEGYVEIILSMRTLYQKCKLVHGDLSEFNILYFEGELYIIDVSQSVHLDHPDAHEFLRADCNNISKFFEKHGVAVMTIEELLAFIQNVDYPTIAVDESVGFHLEKDAEEDVRWVTSVAGTGDVYYQKEQLQQSDTNLKDESSNNPDGQSNLRESESDFGTYGDEDNCSSETEGKGSSFLIKLVAPPRDKKVERKENKKKVKEEKREARKTKIPKVEKKRRKKLAKARMTR